MKLKTLKDFELHGCCQCDVEGIDIKELKAEAIEWVKEYLKKGKNYEGKPQTTNNLIEAAGCIAVVKVFIKFFNITEEDLK